MESSENIVLFQGDEEQARELVRTCIESREYWIIFSDGFPSAIQAHTVAACAYARYNATVISTVARARNGLVPFTAIYKASVGPEEFADCLYVAGLGTVMANVLSAQDVLMLPKSEEEQDVAALNEMAQDIRRWATGLIREN